MPNDRMPPIEVLQVENGYMVREVGWEPAMVTSRKAWVARTVAELGSLIEQLAERAAPEK